MTKNIKIRKSHLSQSSRNLDLSFILTSCTLTGATSGTRPTIQTTVTAFIQTKRPRTTSCSEIRRQTHLRKSNVQQATAFILHVTLVRAGYSHDCRKENILYDVQQKTRFFDMVRDLPSIVVTIAREISVWGFLPNLSENVMHFTISEGRLQTALEFQGFDQ